MLMGSELQAFAFFKKKPQFLEGPASVFINITSADAGHLYATTHIFIYKYHERIIIDLDWCVDIVGARGQSAKGHFRHAELTIEEYN